MTDAEKKALIKKLGAESNKAFNSRYSGGDNRKWFVGKIIDALLARGILDKKNIERLTNEIITKSSAELKARIKKGFSAASLEDKWAKLDQVTSRTQIIYGMIAMHPEFLLPANADYFDFILERRFRSIQRMAFYVNPNDVRNVFAYPDLNLDTPEKMKVNKNSMVPPEPLWTGVANGSLPFILTSRGKLDPDKTVEELFKQNKGSDRNLFGCDPVITILLMDALRRAKDPGKLLRALIAEGDHYLKIDSPAGHFANTRNALKLPIGQRLVGVTSATASAGSHVDIEVGKIGLILSSIQDKLTPDILRDDNYVSFQGGPFFMIVQGAAQERFMIDAVNPVTRMIRVANLTKTYNAGAKIYETRNNFPFYSTLPFHFLTDSRPDKALFEQQSVKSTDLQVGDHLFVINHPLYRMYYPAGAWGGEHSLISEIGSRDSAASIFQTTLKVGGHGLPFTTLLDMGNDMLAWINTVLGILQPLTRIHLDNLKTNGRTTTAEVKFLRRVEKTVSLNVFEYDMPYTHKLFREGGKKQTITAGFVIKEPASDPSVFKIFNANGKDSTLVPTTPAPDVILAVAFVGTSSDDPFAISKWAALYFNAQTSRFESQPLFEKDNKTPKLLTFDDLAKSKPFFVTDDIGDAYITRPRVNFSPTYQTFLKNLGAI
jgi:hypothetical protein